MHFSCLVLCCSVQSQKQSAAVATEDATNAMAERQHTMTEIDRLERMMQTSDNSECEAAAARYYNQKYKRGKKKVDSDEDFSHLEFKYKRATECSKERGTKEAGDAGDSSESSNNDW